MSIETTQPRHKEGVTEKVSNAPKYTREQFLKLYAYFIEHRARLAALPQEIADCKRKVLPLVRRTKLNSEERALQEHYKELQSEHKTLLSVWDVLRKPEYRSLLLELTKQRAATVLVSKSDEPEANEEEKSNDGQDVAPEKEYGGRHVVEWKKIKEKQGFQISPAGFVDAKIAKKYLELLMEYSRELELEFTQDDISHRTVLQYKNFVQKRLLEALGEYADSFENAATSREDRDRIRYRIRRAFEDFEGRLTVTKEVSPSDRDSLLSFLKYVVHETVHDDLDNPKPSYSIDEVFLDL